MQAIDIVLITVLIISVYTDLRYRRIYNKILYPAMVLVLFLQLWQSGFSDLVWSLKGFACGMGCLFIPFILGGIGAGDVKLLGLVGMAKGAYFVFYTFISAAIIGGVMAMFFLMANGRLGYTIEHLMGKKEQLSSITVPYGISIAMGTLVTYWVV